MAMRNPTELIPVFQNQGFSSRDTLLNRYGIITEGPAKYFAKGSFITFDAKEECLARALIMAASSAVLLGPVSLIQYYSDIKSTNIKNTGNLPVIDYLLFNVSLSDYLKQKLFPVGRFVAELRNPSETRLFRRIQLSVKERIS